MTTKKLKIYGGNFDGIWEVRVATTSWPEAVKLMSIGGTMGLGYAKRHGQAWDPRPEDQFLVDEPGVAWRARDTKYPRVWERYEPPKQLDDKGV